MPVAGFAQTSPLVITFQVPLNLTQLSTDITKIRVSCLVAKSEQTGAERVATRYWADEKQVEIPVSGGELATTVSVPVSISGDANTTVGTNANYSCNLIGFSQSLQRWDLFSDAPEAAPFRLIPSPQTIGGSFTW